MTLAYRHLSNVEIDAIIARLQTWPKRHGRDWFIPPEGSGVTSHQVRSVEASARLLNEHPEWRPCG